MFDIDHSSNACPYLTFHLNDANIYNVVQLEENHF